MLICGILNHNMEHLTFCRCRHAVILKLKDLLPTTTTTHASQKCNFFSLTSTDLFIIFVQKDSVYSSKWKKKRRENLLILSLAQRHYHCWTMFLCLNTFIIFLQKELCAFLVSQCYCIKKNVRFCRS